MVRSHVVWGLPRDRLQFGRGLFNISTLSVRWQRCAAIQATCPNIFMRLLAADGKMAGQHPVLFLTSVVVT